MRFVWTKSGPSPRMTRREALRSIGVEKYPLIHPSGISKRGIDKAIASIGVVPGAVTREDQDWLELLLVHEGVPRQVLLVYLGIT